MSVTVREIIELLKAPVGNLENSVDTLKSGNLDMEVKGIAFSFMPTHHVIQTSIEMGANLLITHEGLYFSHHDHSDALKNNSVYQEKRQLIEESEIAIFRVHDYIHRYQPDGITTGLIQALEWQSYVEEHKLAASILKIPGMTVREVTEYIKAKLGIQFVRCLGDESLICTRIGILVGYRGGGNLAIPLFENNSLDLIIYGEGPEWETPEYVRDALYQGKQKALIVLGHAESEEPGMKQLAEWIKIKLPDLPISNISEEPLFRVIS